MTLTIPVWLFWVLGLGFAIPAVVALLYFAWVGLAFWALMRHGVWR